MTDVRAFDPPDYGLRITARRLAVVWREQWRLTAIALLYALAWRTLPLRAAVLWLCSAVCRGWGTDKGTDLRVRC
jgi:hypothetical protein